MKFMLGTPLCNCVLIFICVGPEINGKKPPSDFLRDKYHARCTEKIRTIQKK